MTEKNKDALPTIHYKDLKHLSDMIDNIVYLYQRGWTKEELKSFIDKYCLELVDEKITVMRDNTKSESNIKLGSLIHPYKS